MTITSFDKVSIKQLRAELQAAIDTVTAKHGLVASLGTIRFDQNKFGTRLQVATKTQTAVNPAATAKNTNTVEFEALKRQRVAIVDITKDYFLTGTGRVRFVGYVARRPKYPFVVETVTGKRYKLSALQAQRIPLADAA